MATYIFGDLQGCFIEFQHLLKKINYNEKTDRLGFTGDLVNRGPESLATLRFIKGLKNPIVVLGNHDLHLLAVANQATTIEDDHTLDDILQAPDKEELLNWLRQQPFIHYDADFNYLIVHAGIPPQWSLSETICYAELISNELKGEHHQQFLRNMYGNQPLQWKPHLPKGDRLRYCINAFTRMRFCDANGTLDLTNKTAHSRDPLHIRPWFDWYKLSSRVLFGHWASLEGHCTNSNCEALDTGCIWGRELTVYRIEDQQKFSVPSEHKKI